MRCFSAVHEATSCGLHATAAACKAGRRDPTRVHVAGSRFPSAYRVLETVSCSTAGRCRSGPASGAQPCRAQRHLCSGAHGDALSYSVRHSATKGSTVLLQVHPGLPTRFGRRGERFRVCRGSLRKLHVVFLTPARERAGFVRAALRCDLGKGCQPSVFENCYGRQVSHDVWEVRIADSRLGHEALGQNEQSPCLLFDVSRALLLHLSPGER